MSEENKGCNFYNKVLSCERCELGSILYRGKSNYKYHIDCSQNNDCYYKENKRLREAIENIKFEAEFNGNDESVQKIFGLTKQALGE